MKTRKLVLTSQLTLGKHSTASYARRNQKTNSSTRERRIKYLKSPNHRKTILSSNHSKSTHRSTNTRSKNSSMWLTLTIMTKSNQVEVTIQMLESMISQSVVSTHISKKMNLDDISSKTILQNLALLYKFRLHSTSMKSSFTNSKPVGPCSTLTSNKSNLCSVSQGGVNQPILLESS